MRYTRQLSALAVWALAACAIQYPPPVAAADSALYRLTYTAGAHGTIQGSILQRAEPGQDGTPVTAAAETGFFFDGWSDGSSENPRTDLRVAGDIAVEARFRRYVASVSIYGDLTTAAVATTCADNRLIVTATVRNRSATAYGEFKGFVLPELVLGTDARGYDFSGSGVLVPLKTTTAARQLLSHYPRSYSPVMVLKEGTGLISFAFLYPVLDYRHDSEFAIAYAGQGRWTPTHLTTFFDYPNLPPGAYHSVNAQIPPGTARTYTLVITRGETLAEVVQPYREYFVRKYPGGVQYVRDLAPMVAIALSASDAPGFPNANPYGWYPRFLNADKRGFEAVVKPEVMKHIRGGPGDYNSGNDTFMIWTPTGSVQPALNYPFKFTSRWAAFPGGIAGTAATLKSLVTRGKRMGLWWGHSLDYQPNWNSFQGREVFDPANPVHRAAAHAEMRNAVAAGATFIGLDAFAHGLGRNPNNGSTDGLNQLWYFLPWIRELKRTYPRVKFITEGMASDILHRETASYIECWWDTEKRVHGRHLLADILLPGHEIVASVQFNHAYTAEPALWHGRPYWDPANATTRADLVKALVKDGYVPVVFYSMGLTEVLTRKEPTPRTSPPGQRLQSADVELSRSTADGVSGRQTNPRGLRSVGR